MPGAAEPMSHTQGAPERGRRASVRTVVGVYVAFGVAWILGGDLLVLHHTGVPWVSIGKGLLFVALSAAMIGAMLTVQARRLDRTERRGGVARSHLAALVEHTTLTVISLSPAGAVVTWNPAAEQLIGWTADVVRGRPLTDLSPPGARADHEAMLQAAREGVSRHYETTFLRADGTVVPVGISVGPIRDEAGALIGISLAGRDITERTRLERELRRRAEDFRRLAAIAEEGMYRTEANGTPSYDYVNPALEASTGYTLEDLQTDPDIPHRAVPQDDLAAVERARAGDGTGWPVELRWQRPDGDWVWLELREVPVEDADGRVVATHGLVLDITGRRRQAEALEQALAQEREATERLRRVDLMRRTFLRAVSHELRTPLTSVLGFATTLRDHHRELPADRERMMLDRLLANAHSLQGLLDDLLDVDRLDRGVVTLERQRTDPGLVTRRVLERLDADRRLRLHTETFEADLDVPKLERIVDNLVGNALKHGGPDATVEVRVSHRDGAVLLQVDDDGPGVPDELKEQVFAPFQQGPSAASAAKPGTGIGLSLVRQFAELHGGVAWLEDRPGGGARFLVTLPEHERLSGGPTSDQQPGPQVQGPVEQAVEHGREDEHHDEHERHRVAPQPVPAGQQPRRQEPFDDRGSVERRERDEVERGQDHVDDPERRQQPRRSAGQHEPAEHVRQEQAHRDRREHGEHDVGGRPRQADDQPVVPRVSQPVDAHRHRLGPPERPEP